MQRKMSLLSTMQKAPKDAPERLVRRMKSPAQALAVSIKMSGFKLAFYAASLGKSVSYISRLRSGERPIPEWMVEPLCWLTGTMLLDQVIERLDDSEAATVRRYADELRRAA